MTEVDGRKQGEWDRPGCGDKKTSTSPARDAQAEFRIDYSNVTFSGTDVAVIRPPTGGGYYYQGDLGYISNYGDLLV